MSKTKPVRHPAPQRLPQKSNIRTVPQDIGRGDEAALQSTPESQTPAAQVPSAQPGVARKATAQVGEQAVTAELLGSGQHSDTAHGEVAQEPARSGRGNHLLPEPVLEQLDIKMIVPHPKNPRVIRPTIVDTIAASLRDGGGFPQQHALTVRPKDGIFEVISGHHRLKAAQMANLTHVPCWVQELEDQDALVALVTSNTQTELTPLELGFAALDAVPETGGGESLTSYAERTGRLRANLSTYRKAAIFARKHPDIFPIERWYTRTHHLLAIVEAPEGRWPELAKRCTEGKKGWSITRTRREVAKMKGIASSSETHVRKIGYEDPVEIGTEGTLFRLPDLTVTLSIKVDESSGKVTLIVGKGGGVGSTNSVAGTQREPGPLGKRGERLRAVPSSCGQNER